MTRVDAYIEVVSTQGPEAIVFELKYTDRFSSRRLDLLGNPAYANLATRTGLWADAHSALARGELSQLTRCHALGARAIELATGMPSSPCTLLVVAHRDDDRASAVAGDYRALLSNADRAAYSTLDHLVGVMEQTARVAKQQTAVDVLRLRYIDESQSDALWASPHQGRRRKSGLLGGPKEAAV